MNWIINSKVKTPIGDGILQGRYGHRDAQGEPTRSEMLVRIRITEENQALLGRDDCLTPRAVGSALFVVAENEVVL